MAENTPPTSRNSTFNIQPPPPQSNAGSNTNAPFTPRSSTHTDFDSDSELMYTPIHSPDGPHYDDLPPSYDEAQHQALQDARAGLSALSPNDLEIHRVVLSDDPVVPPPNPAAGPEPGSRTRASGLGRTVPVQHIHSSDAIPVHRYSAGDDGPIPSNHHSTLLDRALDFTHHKPDDDIRYASRLTRYVAIPTQNRPLNSTNPPRESPSPPFEDHHHRGGFRRGRGRGRRHEDRDSREHAPSWKQAAREAHQTSGPGPEAESSDTLDAEAHPVEEPVQFMRAYAKVLHAHSIRPAEFVEFLDGLNALCFAANASPRDLLSAEPTMDSSSDIVRNYIDSANEAFFAPRGLKVSLKSLSTLVDALNIPEERGQRAGATASALDQDSTAELRAAALHPWIERLETHVPSPSPQSVLLRDIGERLLRGPSSAADALPDYFEDDVPAPRDEKAPQAEYASDPRGSVPQPPLGSQGFPPFPAFVPGFPMFPPFGANHGSAPFAQAGNGRGWGPGSFPWGPQPNLAQPHPLHHGGRGRGFGDRGFGGRGFGGRGFGDRGFGGRGFGGRGFGGCGWGPGPRGFGVPPVPEFSAPPVPGVPPIPGYGNGPSGPGFAVPSAPEVPPIPHYPGSPAPNQSPGQWAENFSNLTRMAEWSREAGQRAATMSEHIVPGPPSGIPASGTPFPGPQRPSAQDTRVLPQDSTREIPHSSAAPNVQANRSADDDDDFDASSVFSSGLSDSENEDEHPDTDALFLARVREINAAAEISRQKGKKSAEEIARERAVAIERAQVQRAALVAKIEHKRTKRTLKQELRRRRKEMKEEHRKLKEEVKGLGIKERKKRQKELYEEKKKEWRIVKDEARNIARSMREDRRSGRRGRRYVAEGSKARIEDVVWIVVENLED